MSGSPIGIFTSRRTWRHPANSRLASRPGAGHAVQMGKKLAAWLGWGISALLWAYDRGVNGLGWLAAPTDFVELVAKPWHDYVWPAVLPMLTWDNVLLAAATATLLWVYCGDWVRTRFRADRQWNSAPHACMSDPALGELCLRVCDDIHEYIAMAVDVATIYDPETNSLRKDTWSADIQKMQAISNRDMAASRKRFGAAKDALTSSRREKSGYSG